MHIAPQEWQQLQQTPTPDPAPACGGLQALHLRLSCRTPDGADRDRAAAFLQEEMARLRDAPPELPNDPQALLAWMQANTRTVHAAFADYLAGRRAGGPRRYFPSRAHALLVLRHIAPTKLVDSAWLHGLLPHWRNPRLAPLVRTCVEELGEGQAARNHVVLYRRLLAAHALDPLDDLPDAWWRQGAIQAALGWHAAALLPEVAGFNLAYEQLPLHLLITAHELDELGLDPLYFQLHVTVDNPATGHARRAVQAVLDLLPRHAGSGVFWQRVQAGARLAAAGPGTREAIEGLDLQAELLDILRRKAAAGQGVHADHCRIAGRPVARWLADEGQAPQLLQALQDSGWIVRGAEPADSRFWRLLAGGRAPMFGVFAPWELQVLHDWIRGPAAADGRPWNAQARQPGFRARVASGQVDVLTPADPGPDPDLEHLRHSLRASDPAARAALLIEAMAPCSHWTPAGLEATRSFWAVAAG